MYNRDIEFKYKNRINIWGMERGYRAMKIIKRDGTIVDYDSEKIRVAIGKANNEVSKKEKATDEDINNIIAYIEDLKKSRILVEDIQDIIEKKLMEFGKYQLAKTIHHISLYKSIS